MMNPGAVSVLRDWQAELEKNKKPLPKYEKGEVRTETVVMSMDQLTRVKEDLQAKQIEIVTPNSNALPTQGGY